MPVYLIRAGLGGDVKIGCSAAPLSRLASLQTSHPQRLRLIRVLEGGRAEEKALHSRFKDKRKEGEWFTFIDEMMGDIGLPELPIPFPKRGAAANDTPYGRLRAFHQDVLSCIGGIDALARRSGVPPWQVGVEAFCINQAYQSAAIVLARELGYTHVTMAAFAVLDAANEAESKKDRQACAKQNAAADFVRRQEFWLRSHRREDAWWELATEPAPPKEGAA